MDELGLLGHDVAPWFSQIRDSPYELVEVADEHAESWTETLGVPVRRCYIADAVLQEAAAQSGRSPTELVAAKLPDPGSVMAGDFGEIVVFLYQAVSEHPSTAIGPKKWRLKQDRMKPAPHSDVVHLVLPSWPAASDRDRLLCSEVKTKSTDGDSTPVASAIADCERDRLGRLSRTLNWLRERALFGDGYGLSVEQLERFINATDHPPAEWRFRAVAVICSSLVEGELLDAPDEQPADFTVVVIAIPDLKRRYEAVFAAALASVNATGDPR